MNRKMLAFSLLSSIILLFVVACSSASVTETATTIPPTVTAELPTATAILPTEIPPTATPTLQTRLLFIGHSDTDYNRGLDNHMVGLAASVDPPMVIEGKRIAVWGVSLAAHWLGLRAVPEIQKGNWTVVVLQESYDVVASDEQLFHESVRNFDEEIENVGAETVLIMSWEPESGDPITIEEMAVAYGNIGAELGVKIAPVGLAWERSITERPDLDLYDRDRVHPGIPGTYLTTAVLYATIFGESPEGLPYMPADLLAENASADMLEKWKMSGEDIAFLQRIAWETVVDYEKELN